MANFIRITPFMHVQNIEPALAFFTDVLGFKVYHRSHAPEYAYVQRESVGFRILQATESKYGEREIAYYVDVNDLGEIYAELKPKLDALPKGHVYGPLDQPYGQRELMVRMPDGNVLVYGQTIKKE